MDNEFDFQIPSSQVPQPEPAENPMAAVESECPIFCNPEATDTPPVQQDPVSNLYTQNAANANPYSQVANPYIQQNTAANPYQEAAQYAQPHPAPSYQQPRFEPDSQYRWVRPTTATPVSPAAQTTKTKKAKNKGKHPVLKVISVILVILLCLGSGVLGGLAGMQYMQYQAENSDDVTPNSTAKDTETDILVGNRETSIIDTHKIDTGKKMEASEVYALNVNSTVGITTAITTNYWGYTTTSAASGSGFIYSDDGYIITNYHVVEGSSSISVSFYDGESADAKLIGYDESNDVAVLKVDRSGLPPVIIGDSDNMNVGDSVIAIGNPLGELTFSLTAGTVSALDREVTFSGGITMNLIQTDCAINSGNSGGALFNLYGEVIGITNAKYSGNSSSGASIDNIGFAIPMNHAKSIVDSIIENGYVVKPYIGVTITDVSEESQGYGLPSGASVQGIIEDSPAEEAGLKKNDIITHVNGEKIDTSSDLKSIVAAHKPGDVLTLTVWRRNETLEIRITIGKQTQESQPQAQQEQSSQMPYYPNYGW